MDRLRAMEVFAEVATRGSLTDAADALEMSRAMVSRYLQALEQWLGVRLLHRTTRRVGLTAAGEEALERCRPMLALRDELQAVAGERGGALRGRLRITTSPSFAEAHLADAVAAFVAAQPQVQVELVSVERAVDLAEERIDLAVRISRRLDDGLVARRLAACRSVVCASPAYVAAHGRPAAAEDLAAHRCLTHAQVSRSEFRLRRGGTLLRVPVAGPLQCNETTALRRAALAGAGIALLPTYLVADDIAQGRLLALLPDCEPEVMDVFAVYLSRRQQPPLLRAMLDFLAERFGGEVAPWDRVLEVQRADAKKRK